MSSGDISVVIPAYNAAKYLPQTLQTVFAQTRPAEEVIVVDDGSSDDTAAVARALGARVITIQNAGGSAARNVGTIAARGEFIAFLDADDLWTREKLAVQQEALAAYPGPAFSFTDFRIFDQDGVYRQTTGMGAHPAFRKIAGRVAGGETIVISADARRPALADMYFLPSSALVRRADVLAVGGFEVSLRGCEDYEFFLRLFDRVPAVAVMRPLLLYRRHAAQTTASAIFAARQEFKIQRLVLAAPHRYPSADVRHFARKGALLHHRIGLYQARLGQFDEAADSLAASLAERRTFRSAALAALVRCARTRAGRATFSVAHELRRRLRPRGRTPISNVLEHP